MYVFLGDILDLKYNRNRLIKYLQIYIKKEEECLFNGVRKRVDVEKEVR